MMRALRVSLIFREQARPTQVDQSTDQSQGHITYRDPVEPDTFWVNPFGTAFSLIKASDLIRVSEEGKVIEGGENRLLNAAAFAIVCVFHMNILTQHLVSNIRIIVEHADKRHLATQLDVY